MAQNKEDYVEIFLNVCKTVDLMISMEIGWAFYKAQTWSKEVGDAVRDSGQVML